MKSIAGYGTGYVVGELAGDAIGGKIGSKIKRDLNEKDLEIHKKQMKTREGYINYLKSHNFDSKNTGKFDDDDEVVLILNKYGVSDDQPDNYNYRMLNKNKQKIIKEIQELKNHNQEVLKDPKKYPGNHEKAGRMVGSGIGIAGGLLAAHKFFSMKEEDLKRRIASPSNLKNLPIPIQKYYQSGINKDLYRLAQLQGTIDINCMVGPIPCPGEFTKEKDGKTYKSIFGYSIDDIDLGKADIWYDENGDLYKMSGIFFRSFKQININELKDYLKKQIVEDDFVGEAYKGDKNYQQIVSLEKQIISKIDRI